jgi:hypothetical protein
LIIDFIYLTNQNYRFDLFLEIARLSIGSGGRVQYAQQNAKLSRNSVFAAIGRQLAGNWTGFVTLPKQQGW